MSETAPHDENRTQPVPIPGGGAPRRPRGARFFFADSRSNSSDSGDSSKPSEGSEQSTFDGVFGRMDEYSDHSRNSTSSSQGGGHQIVDLPPVPARSLSLTQLCAQCSRRFTASTGLRMEVHICEECRRRPSRERDTSACQDNSIANARPSDVPQPRSSDGLPHLWNATYPSENTRGLSFHHMSPSLDQSLDSGSARGRPFPAANRGPSSGQFPHGVRPSELPDVTLYVGSPAEESVLHQALRRR